MITTSHLPSRALFSATVVFLISVFALGGASRADVLSLIILRPLTALFLALGIAFVSVRQIRLHWPVLSIPAALVGLALLHLLPWPPAIYGALPGQDLATQVLAAVEKSYVWKPLSIAPWRTWNVIFALVAPLAMAILACGLTNRQFTRIYWIVLGIGFASALLGIAQVIGPPNGVLYLYRITNGSDAVGLFANRNHQAFLLASLYPILAYVAVLERGEAARTKFQRNLAVIGGISLIPLILVTGSRSGLVLLLIGIATSPLLYQAPQETRKARRFSKQHFRALYLLYGVAAVMIGIFGFFMTRATSLNRLIDGEEGAVSRSSFWPEMPGVIWSYFPFGSGAGTFVEAYQIVEPSALLTPRYINHAHNDLLEAALTMGLPGLAIVFAGVAMWAWGSIRVFSNMRNRNLRLARSAAVIVGMLLISSLGDYPLRTPALACLFAFLSIVLWRGAREAAGSTAARQSTGFSGAASSAAR